MTEDEARIQLRAWVVGRGKVSDAELKDGSNLLGDGLINSLDVVELFAHIESLNGTYLDTAALKGTEFQSIDSLVAAFFKVPA